MFLSVCLFVALFSYVSTTMYSSFPRDSLVPPHPGSKQGLRNLSTTVTKMDAEALQQQQILYQQDFQVDYTFWALRETPLLSALNAIDHDIHIFSSHFFS
jgi:hypothetical protein